MSVQLQRRVLKLVPSPTAKPAQSLPCDRRHQPEFGGAGRPQPTVSSPPLGTAIGEGKTHWNKFCEKRIKLIPCLLLHLETQIDFWLIGFIETVVLTAF